MYLHDKPQWFSHVKQAHLTNHSIQITVTMSILTLFYWHILSISQLKISY